MQGQHLAGRKTECYVSSLPEVSNAQVSTWQEVKVNSVSGQHLAGSKQCVLGQHLAGSKQCIGSAFGRE